MSKTVVIYKSKYGSTKQYAEWISESLSCEIFEAKEINIEDLKEYDTVIYGGGIYANFIDGFKKIKKKMDKITEKKIIVFAVGLADPEKEEDNSSIIKVNFGDEIKEKIQYFQFRGAMDFEKLSFIHKVLMKMVAKVQQKQTGEKVDAKEKKDYINKESIKPLIEYVK